MASFLWGMRGSLGRVEVVSVVVFWAEVVASAGCEAEVVEGAAGERGSLAPSREGMVASAGWASEDVIVVSMLLFTSGSMSRSASVVGGCSSCVGAGSGWGDAGAAAGEVDDILKKI